METTQETVNSILRAIFDMYPVESFKWVEEYLDYIHKDDTYDYVCENASGRCDR